jgi:beta-1,4-mannosyltransferase
MGTLVTPSRPAQAAPPIRLACLSRAPDNPYLDLLYAHLAAEGVVRVDGGSLSPRWLATHRRKVQVLHVHWQEVFYRTQRGPKALRSALSWLKLVRFAVRLRLAAALGYRIAWTVHQVTPHERTGAGLDVVGARLLASAADVLVAHDETTAADVRRLLGAAGRRIVVVPHGSYIGVYPPGRSRAEVRAELDVPTGAFAFLAFGELRGYKSVELLLDAFSRARLPDAVLVITGNAKDAVVANAVRAAAAGDSRIHFRPGLVPVGGVAELFGACDAAVCARGDGGTSGSLILALSLGLPVLAADSSTYRALTADGRAGWLFAPGDADSLRTALEAAAGDDTASARGAEALALAETLDWSVAAARLAELFRAATTSGG